MIPPHSLGEETDLVDLQELSIMVAAGTLIIGVISQIDTTRRGARTAERELETRQAQFFLQIYDNFHQADFFDKFTDILTWKWAGYEDFMLRYGRDANPRAWYSEASVAAFFEGVGVLVHRKLIDPEIVGELMSRHIVLFWEKMSPVSLEMRKRLQMPVDVWLENLYYVMKPIAQEQMKKAASLQQHQAPG